MSFICRKFLQMTFVLFVVWSGVVSSAPVSPQKLRQIKEYQMKKAPRDFAKIISTVGENAVFCPYGLDMLQGVLLVKDMPIWPRFIPADLHLAFMKSVLEKPDADDDILISKNFLLTRNHFSNEQKDTLSQFPSTVFYDGLDSTGYPTYKNAAIKVNNVISKLSNGKFNKEIAEKSTANFTGLNLTYFKGKWAFSCKDTSKDIDFHDINGKLTKRVTAFYIENNRDKNKDTKIRYAKQDEHEIYYLPLDHADGKYEMQIIVPPKSEAPEKSLQNEELYERIVKTAKTAKFLAEEFPRFELIIPNFSIEQTHNLSDQFESDISPIYATQKIFIKVDKNGAETGATTKVLNALYVPSEKIYIDRPFAFLIVNKENGNIISMGVVNKPEYDIKKS